MAENVIMYSNNFATITEYKSGFKKACVDYVIRFQSQETSIHTIMENTFDIFKQLIEDYYKKDKTVKCRLVAKVQYVNMKTENEVPYYHGSFPSAIVDDIDNFFYRHMLKIAERMENFSNNGSDLLIRKIEEIHIHVTVLN